MAIRLFSSAEDLHHESGETIMAEINITPIIDVFLVLLIIFMVSSSVVAQKTMHVNLPEASSVSLGSQAPGVIITLISAGEVLVNQQPAIGKTLEKRLVSMERLLKEAFTQTASRVVILEGDREAALGSAISIMDHARHAGAENFSIATSEKRKFSP